MLPSITTLLLIILAINVWLVFRISSIEKRTGEAIVKRALKDHLEFPLIAISETQRVSIEEALSNLHDVMECIASRDRDADSNPYAYAKASAWRASTEWLSTLDNKRYLSPDRYVVLSSDDFEKEIRDCLRYAQNDSKCIAPTPGKLHFGDGCISKKEHDVQCSFGYSDPEEVFDWKRYWSRSALSDDKVELLVTKELAIFLAWKEGFDERPEWRIKLVPHRYTETYIEESIRARHREESDYFTRQRRFEHSPQAITAQKRKESIELDVEYAFANWWKEASGHDGFSLADSLSQFELKAPLTWKASRARIIKKLVGEVKEVTLDTGTQAGNEK